MKCLHVQACFDELYRQGDKYDRKEVVAHLNSCDRCRQAYETWRGIAEALRNSPAVAPPEGFAQKVMAAIEKPSRHPTIIFFITPQRLAWAAALVVTLCGIFIVQHLHSGTNIVLREKTITVESVHFECTIDNATNVALVGDFNGWDKQKNPMKKTGEHTWAADLPMSKGSYQYLLLVDGKVWKNDPSNTSCVPDGFGGYNSEIDL